MQKLFENFRKFLNEAREDDWLTPPYTGIGPEDNPKKSGQKFEGQRGEILDFRHDPNLKTPGDWLSSAQLRGHTRDVNISLHYEENYDVISGEKHDRPRWVLRVRVGPTAGKYHGLDIPELTWNWAHPEYFRIAKGKYGVRGQVYTLPPHLEALWQAQAIEQAELKMLELDRELQGKIKEKSKDFGLKDPLGVLQKEIDTTTKKLRMQRALLESFRKVFKSSVPSIKSLHAIAANYYEGMKKMDMEDLEGDLGKPRGDDYEDPRSSRVGDNLDERFWKRVGDEGVHIDRMIAQVTDNPEAYLDLYFDKVKIDDPIISKAKRIGWEKLSRLERKLVRNRLVSLQLVRDLKLMNRKNPIIKNIDVLDAMVEAWEELSEIRLNLEDLSEEGSREMTVANKKPNKNWFKSALKRLPYFGAFFGTAFFPYNDAYAAYIRGLERKAGIREDWDGTTSMTVGGAVQTLAGVPLIWVGDSQAELHSLILLEIIRLADPGVELTELVMILANKYGPEVAEWLMKGRRYFGPSKEDIEDYPELGRQYEPDVRTGSEKEDIGPVPDPEEDLQEMKMIFENWRKWK